MSDTKASKPPTAIGIRLFGRSLVLTGKAAHVCFLLLLLGLAALWVVMMIYWSAG